MPCLLACWQAGWQSLYLDAFGEHSGQAYAYSNTIATLAGIAAPVIASNFVRVLGQTAGYRATFAIFGPAVGLPAVGLFCRFASARRLTGLGDFSTISLSVSAREEALREEELREDELSLSSLMHAPSSPSATDDDHRR